MATTRSIRHELTVPATAAGKRLDQVLAESFPDYSRSRIQAWIRRGRVRVDERALRPRDRLVGGERVCLEAEFEEVVPDRPQPLPLAVVFEDEALLVVDKPAGQVVHPGAGNPDRTLLNALLHHAPALAELPRAGIVHRLDKDTSGLLVVARTPHAHATLVRQLARRDIEREYEAVCVGRLTAGGRIEAPIGRHPIDRKRMAVRPEGRTAVTAYRVLRRFRGHSHLGIRLETGRTHQIRVHLAHAGYPLAGDSVYGRRQTIPPGIGEQASQALRCFRRQALHAAHLRLAHPVSGRRLEFHAAPPADLRQLLAALAEDFPDG